MLWPDSKMSRISMPCLLLRAASFWCFPALSIGSVSTGRCNGSPESHARTSVHKQIRKSRRKDSQVYEDSVHERDHWRGRERDCSVDHPRLPRRDTSGRTLHAGTPLVSLKASRRQDRGTVLSGMSARENDSH